MNKQSKIETIRRKLVRHWPANDEAKLNEYFKSLGHDKDKFLGYILEAGLTIEGILKPMDRRKYIQICDELIDRIYEPGVYYDVIRKHIDTNSARRMIIEEARIRGKAVIKIFHQKDEIIEIINL